jgi:hypothetical protein
MYEPVTPFEIQRKYLDQHFEQYVAFTRLILSLATGSESPRVPWRLLGLSQASTAVA